MIALDTNILVHAHRRDSALHLEAVACVRALAESPAPWAICFHSLVEFYGVATNAKIWTQASSAIQAADQIDAWRESPSLRIPTDSHEDLTRLLEMAARAKVAGPMIHDARIANCCLVNGISELWTIDRDFSRFPDLKTKNPLVG
ncbi:MAG: putative nucleic acid-binding protein [Verrucomicrobiales bacterium]